MRGRVRYLCIPITSLELAAALPDQGKAIYIDQTLRLFTLCESEDDPVPEQTESRVLDIALAEAAREIEKGYKTYVKRMNARNGADDPDQRSINDQSMIAIEENGSDMNGNDPKESSELSEGEGMQGGRPLSEIELQSINSALSYAGISPDSQFYSYAKKVGCRITVDSIRKARDERSRSIAYVVKLMREAAEGGRS